VTLIFCLHSPKKNPIRVCHLLGFFVYLLGFGIWNTNSEARKRERERERGWGTTNSTTNFVIVWKLLPGLRFYLDPARKLCTIPNLQRRFLVGVLVGVLVFWFLYQSGSLGEGLREGGREEEMAGGELDNGVTSALPC